MKRTLIIMVLAFTIVPVLQAREWHVSKSGKITGAGTKSDPFPNISRAAGLALPGDVIIVHQGEYREMIVPLRGGSSDVQRIVYRAAENENVVIKGSEQVKGWLEVRPRVWKLTLENEFFGDYNPYADTIHGDWFKNHGRRHHTGAVYIDGKALYESENMQGVLEPGGIFDHRGSEINGMSWFCEQENHQTHIYANFKNLDPGNHTVEINVRKSCFYPDRPGVNYITISGFTLRHAATQWAPPTAEQIGLIGTHWSKGWIIENNVISDSRCVGITLGKDRATGQNVWSANREKSGTTHYNEVIFRALKAGWSKGLIGSHIVRNNVIYNCEQAGIVGSLGAVFSQVYDNHIYDIWTRRAFSGAEIAGIKIHAPVDMLIRNNRIHNVGRGIWIDWMAQGTRITSNLLYDNTTDDLFTEVNHGPYVVDHNILLSNISIRDWSGGGAFIHNLINGMISVNPEVNRFTPYMFPHETMVAGLKNVAFGDNRYLNNIFSKIDEDVENDFSRRRAILSSGLEAYNDASLLLITSGNLYLNGSKPVSGEEGAMTVEDLDPELRISEEGKHGYLHLTLPGEAHVMKNRLISSEDLNLALVSSLPFEDPGGNPLVFDSDFFGLPRSEANPLPGPFEKIEVGEMKIKLW